MKRIAFCLVVALLVTACVPTAREGNFTLNWKYYPCSGGPRFLSDPASRGKPLYVVDTSEETLAYMPLGESRAIIIRFRFTDEEANTIYERAASIGFFDYPSIFMVPAAYIQGLHTPAAAYELSIGNGGWSNSVTWSDHPIVAPPYGPADRLRELMDLIEKIVVSHPEVENLPWSSAQCA